MEITSQHDSHYVADSQALWGCSVDHCENTGIRLLLPLWKKLRRINPNCYLVYNQTEPQGLRKEEKEPTSGGHLSSLFGQLLWIRSMFGYHPPPAVEARRARHSFCLLPLQLGHRHRYLMQASLIPGNLQTVSEAQWPAGMHDGIRQRY